MALDPAVPSARDLLNRPEIAARRRKLEVDDPGVLDNIDTPEQLDRIRATEAEA